MILFYISIYDVKYKFYLLSKIIEAITNNEGIMIMNIYDFLLESKKNPIALNFTNVKAEP